MQQLIVAILGLELRVNLKLETQHLLVEAAFKGHMLSAACKRAWPGP